MLEYNYRKNKCCREEFEMNNFKIEQKDAFRFVGFKTKLEGSQKIHSEQFSNQKIEFFKGMLKMEIPWLFPLLTHQSVYPNSEFLA
jgi:hypothetical protein